MEENEPLGSGTEHHLAQSVADGTATSDEARQLLVEFVRQARTSGKVSSRLIEHFEACVGAYLAGKKTLLPAPEVGRYELVGVPVPTLEKAFGLTRIAPGNPRIDEGTLAVVAMEVLQLVLAGESVQEAAAIVADSRKANGKKVSSESQVRDAWASHKVNGLVLLRFSRVINDPSWSREELDRLNKIFDGVPGIVPPGMTIEDYWRHILPDEPLSQAATPNNSENKPA